MPPWMTLTIITWWLLLILGATAANQLKCHVVCKVRSVPLRCVGFMWLTVEFYLVLISLTDGWHVSRISHVIPNEWCYADHPVQLQNISKWQDDDDDDDDQHLIILFVSRILFSFISSSYKVCLSVCLSHCQPCHSALIVTRCRNRPSSLREHKHKNSANLAIYNEKWRKHWWLGFYLLIRKWNWYLSYLSHMCINHILNFFLFRCYSLYPHAQLIHLVVQPLLHLDAALNLWFDFCSKTLCLPRYLSFWHLIKYLHFVNTGCGSFIALMFLVCSHNCN